VVSIDDRSGAGSAGAAGEATVPDEHLRLAYDAGADAGASPIVEGLVRAFGLGGALWLAPRLVMGVPRVAATGDGPGCVRLRWTMGATERRLCLERQGALLALGDRFGSRPCVLDEISCVGSGDAVCECRLQTVGGPRWALVVVAAAVGAVAGAIVGPAGVLPLPVGIGAAAVAYAVERRRSGRAGVASRVAASRAFRRLVESARSQMPPPGPPVRGAEGPFRTVAAVAPVFEQEGDVWRVTFEDTMIRVRHSRGVALLNQLLRHPGQELHVQTLDALVPSAGAGGEHPPVGLATLPSDGMSVGLGDAGPVLDERARAEYRRRLAELRGELEDAERCNDPGRAAAARFETEQLGDELRAATGLGGRARRASSDVDRMRIAVTRRIRAAIEQVGKLHPALGEHLERRVRTGFTCAYLPVERSS
jgi:hypothetical protein